MPYHHPFYMCCPSVVKVGAPTEVSIVPQGSCHFFREDENYEVAVIAMRGDMVDYHDPIDYMPAKAENGCLKFTFTFDMESEYSVRFRTVGGAYKEIFMYAVREDLYELRPLKGDLHTHSYYSDGADDVCDVAASYRENGFDFFSLTDHNRYYTSQMMKEAFEDVNLGMTLILGEEVHTPGTSLHIVHIGGKESVCDRYIHHRDEFEAEVAEIEAKMTHVPVQYRHRMALAKWSCENVHKAGGIAIFAHPFWKSNIYNDSEEFCDLLFDEKIFDAFEAIGGCKLEENNLQIALWMEQWIKGNKIPGVGSSDSHLHAFMQECFGRSFTVVFAKDDSPEAIMEAIKNGMTLPGELSLDNPEEVRFYGEFRLVQYANFLFRNYFEVTKRMMAGEGNMMRRYLQDNLDGKLLSAMADSVKDFYEVFFGRKAPTPVSAKRMAFYEKWRTHQIEHGPKTKGSVLEYYNGGSNAARK